MQKGKYYQEWLMRNNLTENWFHEQFTNIAESIIACKSSVLKFFVTDYQMLEACIPACYGYTFHVGAPDSLGYIEVTVYLK